MRVYDQIKIMPFILMMILLSPVMAAQIFEVTGGSTETNTVTGGITVTYSGTGVQGVSGGGGGGGPSGENFTNIEGNEKYYLYIFKDKVTSYRFVGSGPVIFVNITGNTSPGEIRTSVEVLKDVSTLVKEPAPCKVYKNTNIWVGTSGFAVPRNIKEAVIRFRVENEWMNSNGLSQSDMKMYRWDGTGWFGLETDEKGIDGTYSYFESKTDSFSSFAICGLKNAEIIKSSIPLAGENASTLTTGPSDPARPEKSAGFEAAILIIAVSAVSLARYWKN